MRAGFSVVRRLLALLGLLLLSLSAHAVVPLSYGYYGGQGTSSPLLSTCDAAVERMIATYYAPNNPTKNFTHGPCGTFAVETTLRDWATVPLTETPKAGGASSTYNGIVYREKNKVCPANSSPVTGGCGCNAGFQEDATHTMCVPVQTEAEAFCQGMTGFTRKMSGETGSTSPESVCMVIDPPFPNEPGKGCTMTTGDNITTPKEGGGNYWAGIGKYVGSTCTPSPDPVLGTPRQALEDDCSSGFAGMVNGVKTCVPSVPDKGITGIKTSSGTNADGSQQTTKETTTCNGQECTTVKNVTTTPAGGGTPTTVTSSTTTTLADKCHTDPANPVCTKGGGSSASTGTGNGDEQGAECGIDGKPACKVKIDETGVPTEAEGKDALGDAVDALKDKQAELIDQAGQKARDSVGDWGFGFSFPTGCASHTLDVFPVPVRVDPCQWQGTVHELVGMLWILCTVAGCIGMVGRTLHGGS